MLADKRMFDSVEEILSANGTLTAFEAENGEITGRMMITLAEIPEGIELIAVEGRNPQAFEATFDFYDSAVGVAIYTDTRNAATGIWITPQQDKAEPPAHDLIEFFIQKIMENLGEDGSFGVPIYSFVNNTCDITIVPAQPNDH